MNIVSEHKSADMRRRAYRTSTHLVFQLRKLRRESIQWRKIYAPIAFHPDTPEWYLDQLITDWTDRNTLEYLPTAWLQGKAVNIFVAAPPLIPAQINGMVGNA